MPIRLARLIAVMHHPGCTSGPTTRRVYVRTGENWRRCVEPKQPIRDVTKLDLLGRRHDSGLDLGIVADGPLDGSAQTRQLVEQKVRNYLKEVVSDEFRNEFEPDELQNLTIRLETDFAIDPEVMDLLASLRREAAQLGVRLIVIQHPG